MPLTVKPNQLPAKILALSLLLALVGCGGDSPETSNNSTVDPTENAIENFPRITIKWPAPLVVNVVQQMLNPAATSRQIFLRATITQPGMDNQLELNCEAAVDPTAAQTAQVAYNDLIANSGSRVAFIEINDTTSVDGREGREYLFNQTLEDSSILTGLAHAYYFNANTDRLVRNWRYLVQCTGTPVNFSNRRTLINTLLDSIDFSPTNQASRSALAAELTYTMTDSGMIIMGDTTASVNALSNTHATSESSAGL